MKLKKRINATITLTITLGMVFVSGCGNSEKVIEGEVQNIVIESENAQPEKTERAAESTPVEKEDAGHTGTSSKGYVFTYQGTAVEIDADAASVIEELGEPVTYFEAPSCAFEGLDKIYTYNGFELDTYPNAGIDCISAIIFKDDSVTTAEGIGIGDMIEKLEQAYGSESTREDGMLVYSKDDMELCFILRENEIISIEYRSTVLE